jgi:fatty-acid desaturase
MMLRAWLWSLIPTFLMAVPVTTVYLHRTVTHRAVTLHPVVEWWFKFINWVTTGVDPAVWAAVHRKHHKYSDIEVAEDKRDPHSPWLEGFWHIQLGNVWYYIAELRKHPDTLTTFARDVLSRRGWWDRTLFRRGWMGLLFGTSVLWVVLGLHAWLTGAPLKQAWLDGLGIGGGAAARRHFRSAAQPLDQRALPLAAQVAGRLPELARGARASHVQQLDRRLPHRG